MCPDEPKWALGVMLYTTFFLAPEGDYPYNTRLENRANC
ncbi:conserved hypothetical protein [Vibrio parahaemolyticus]